MPAVSAVPVALAVSVLKNYITHFTTDELPKHSSTVWKDISKDLNGLWTDSAVRFNVRYDRRQILTLARNECGIFIPSKEKNSANLNVSSNISDVKDDINGNDNDDTGKNEDDDDDNEKDDDDGNDSEKNEYDDEVENFDVTITREEWNMMKRSKPLVSKGRKYFGFEPGVWTNIVSFAFWKQYHLKCAVVFKRAKIYENGGNYAVITGRCKDRCCRNPVRGIIKDCPKNDGPVVITMKCRDTRFSRHADVKRPLNGQKRKEIQEKLLRSGVSGWRKEEAKNILNPGDTGSPFLYESKTLHQAKKEAIDKEIGIDPKEDKEPVLAIRKMNQDPQYANSIIFTSDTKFSVFYATPTQFHAYAEYQRIHKQHSSICIDATGGVVRKLINFRDKKSGSIFLYQIVVNFNGTTIPVYQMLSEMHDAKFISFWLSRWVEKVLLPRQAVSDGSKAILNAMSESFNGQSLKEYINCLFENVTANNKSTPRTFIRLDAAHFLHAVSKWKCFQSALHKIVISFFLFCVALMVDCRELSSLEEIFLLTIIVCKTEFEDSIIHLNDDCIITPGEARKTLEQLISDRNADITIIDSIEIDDEKTMIFGDSEMKSVNNNGLSIALLTWIDNLCRKANNVIAIGEKLNTHYLPGLYSNLVDKIKEFPIWSNVCTPDTMSRPTSCYVETDFKDLKMTLKKKVNLPTTITKFLRLHIANILGGVNIFQSKLTKFVVDNCSQEESKKPKDDHFYEREDKHFYENWKGLGKNGNERDHHWMNDYVNRSKVEDGKSNSANSLTDGIDSEVNVSLPKNKNNSEIQFQNHNDHNYSLSLTEDNEDQGLSINTINVDNEYILNEELSTHDKSEDIIIDSTGTRDNHILNLSSSTHYSENNLTEPVIYSPKEINTINKCVRELMTSNKENKPISVAVENEPLSVAVEYMMKQKLMNKKPGRYFQNCPEAALLNNLVTGKTGKTLKKRKNFLLRNVCNVCINSTGPAMFKGKKWTALNTCPFDTTIQMMFTGAIDNPRYLEYITKSKLPIFNFLKLFIDNGVTDNATDIVYEQRMSILNPIYHINSAGEDGEITIAPSIDCEDNVVKLWRILFKNSPSVVESTICSNRLCGIHSQNFPVISANHLIIAQNGFTALGKALEFHHKIYNVRCRFCNKAKATRIAVPKEHVIIELDIRDNLKIKRGKKCRLSELPIHLNLTVENDDGIKSNLRYRLSGVAAFITGHYYACCRRLTGNWQIYNDCSTTLESATVSTEIEPHGAFYILE